MTHTKVTIRKNKTSTLYAHVRAWGGVLSCVGLVVYGVALVSTIVDTAHKKQLARTVRDEATNVATLEQTYYQSVGKITVADAHEFGYQTPKLVRYGALHPEKSLARAR